MMLTQLAKEKYISLETFRKDGTGVKTPVWFVEKDGVIFVRTQDTSWKVKRVKNNPRVRLAPCTAPGTVTGEWVDAQASVIEDEAIKNEVSGWLGKKYGLTKLIFEVMLYFRRAQMAVIRVEAV